VDCEGLGVYDRLEQGVCIAWALLGNEFSIAVVGLPLFKYEDVAWSNTHKKTYIYIMGNVNELFDDKSRGIVLICSFFVT